MCKKSTEITPKLKCMFENNPVNRLVIFIVQNSGIFQVLLGFRRPSKRIKYYLRIKTNR